MEVVVNTTPFNCSSKIEDIYLVESLKDNKPNSNNNSLQSSASLVLHQLAKSEFIFEEFWTSQNTLGLKNIATTDS